MLRCKMTVRGLFLMLRVKDFGRRLNLKRCGGIFLLSLLISAQGCQTQKPSEKLREELQTVTSWAATVRAVAGQWNRGAVLTVYAVKTFEAAGQSLDDEMKRLGKDSEIAAEKREAALSQMQNLKAIVGAMRDAAQKEDHSNVNEQAEQLAGVEQALKALSESDAAK